jgi:hypothetical protein
MEDVKLFNEFKTYNDIKERFLYLKDIINNVHGITYNPTYMLNNKEYDEIIEMGDIVVPFLMEDVIANDSIPTWGKALRAITGVENSKKGMTTTENVKAWENWYKNEYKK